MEKKLTIDTLCGGAVQERVNRGLRKVADNILDPNTEAKKKRTVTLTLTFIPNEDDREDVSVEAAVTIKLASEESTHTQLFINKDISSDIVTITEHAKGEIKGQLSFNDFGVEEASQKAVTEDDQNFDPETGEIYQSQNKVMTFKRAMEV